MARIFTQSNLRRAVFRYRGLGISISIIMVLAGLLMCVFPYVGAMCYTVSLIIALFAGGVMNIIRYATSKRREREIWLLINGLIFLCTAFFFLLSIITEGRKEGATLVSALAQTTDSLLFWSVSFLGWTLIIRGILRLLGASYKVQAGGSRRYEITMGVISIVLGSLMSICPYWNETMIMLGIYVIAIAIIHAGITLFIDLACSPNIRGVMKDQKGPRRPSMDKDIPTVDARPLEDETTDKS